MKNLKRKQPQSFELGRGISIKVFEVGEVVKLLTERKEFSK